MGVPPRYAPALAEIQGWSEAQVTAVVDALLTHTGVVSPEELSSRLDECAHIENKRLLVDALVGLALTFADDEDVDWPSVTAQVAKAVGIEPAEAIAFAIALTRLVQAEPVFLLAKAFEVARANAPMYERAKVVTDMRPVFRRHDLTAPAGMLILHSLGVHVEGASESESLHLTSVDLDDLIDELQRAKAKEASLQRAVGDLGIPELRLEEATGGS